MFLLLGANLADCHPILFRRIAKRLAADPENVRVIVVDPRRTETADLAHSFLPIRPGTDVALLNAMLRVALVEGHLAKEFIADHTDGFEAVERSVAPWTPEAAGDYTAGPSHVLPTAGGARFASPLGVWDFCKYTSVLSLSADGLRRQAEAITTLARAEGLEGHARAVERRLNARNADEESS